MTLLDPRANELYASKLYSASIIGHTTAHSARIWIRLYEPGQWTLVVSKQPFSGDLKRLGEHDIAAFLQKQAIQPCAVLSHDFSYASNLTHCFDVDGAQQRRAVGRGRHHQRAAQAFGQFVQPLRQGNGQVNAATHLYRAPAYAANRCRIRLSAHLLYFFASRDIPCLNLHALLHRCRELRRLHLSVKIADAFSLGFDRCNGRVRIAGKYRR